MNPQFLSGFFCGFTICATLLSFTTSGLSQERKPSAELLRLAYSYSDQLMQPYRTSRGTLKSEKPEKYGYRFSITLTKESRVLRVVEAVMGHGTKLQIIADENDVRKVYFYNADGIADECSMSAVTSRSRSPTGQVIDGKGVECEKASEPLMADFIAALKEYDSTRPKK